jgi:hypothetical protein
LQCIEVVHVEHRNTLCYSRYERPRIALRSIRRQSTQLHRMQFTHEHAHIFAVVDRRHDQMHTAFPEGRFQHRREFAGAADARALCTEKSNPGVVMVKSAQDGGIAEPAEKSAYLCLETDAL